MHQMFHKLGMMTIRQDRDALFGYLPQNGFAFFAPRDDCDKLINWLKSDGAVKPPQGYECFSNAEFIPTGIMNLGNPNFTWDTIPIPKTPLVINWMITGQCNHKCRYCYAQDLMNSDDGINEKIVFSTIEALKYYQPIAVAITGGEPSLSPYFATILNELSKFTSVIVDTNASQLSDEHLLSIIKNKAHVRVSLDSHVFQKNAKTRIAKDKKNAQCLFLSTLNNLILLVEKGVPVTIHTVATTYNYDDMKSFLKDMDKFQVQKISIRIVEESSLIHDYAKIYGGQKRCERFLKHIVNNIHVSGVKAYISLPRVRNSIVIVSPKGDFYTESPIPEKGKIIIDKNTPSRPSLENIVKNVDMHAHASRYLLK